MTHLPLPLDPFLLLSGHWGTLSADAEHQDAYFTVVERGPRLGLVLKSFHVDSILMAIDWSFELFLCFDPKD